MVGRAGGVGLARGAGREGKAEGADEETQLPERPRRDVPPVAK